METPATLLVIALCAALALHWLLRRRTWQRTDVPWPFYAKKPLPTPGQALYLRLVSALPGHIVLAGVEVADVLGVKRGFDAPTWRRRLRHLRYDFVVCAKDATVVAAISLDDTPQGKNNRSRSERIKEQASAAAGVRLIRWQAKAMPDLLAIRAIFGVVQRPIFEEIEPSANPSWWPAMTSTERNPPRH